MLPRACSILLLVTGLCLPAATYAQRTTQATSFPSTQLLARFGLVQAWWNQATINPARDKVTHLTADEQVVFVQSSAGAVTAFDADSGRRLWSSQLGPADAPNFPVTTNDRMALVIAGLDLFAVNKFTGRLIWRLKLPSQPSSSPVSDDELLYVGMLDGSCYAFDLREIEKLYDLDLLPQWSYKCVKWRYRTSKPIVTPPLPLGSVVYFASQDKSLYAVTKEERSPKFQLETDAPISAPLSSSSGLLFMASQDFNVYCINQTSGNIRWTFVTGVPVHKAPVVVNGNFYVSPERGGVYKLDAVSGRHPEVGNYWLPKMVDFVAANDKQIFLTDGSGDLAVVDAEQFVAVGQLPLRGFSKRIRNDRTDRIIVATPTGLVLLLHQAGNQFPDYHMFPDRKPIAVELAPNQPQP